MRWYGHVLRRNKEDDIRRALEFEVEGVAERGRPRMGWRELMKPMSVTCIVLLYGRSARIQQFGTAYNRYLQSLDLRWIHIRERFHCKNPRAMRILTGSQ